MICYLALSGCPDGAIELLKALLGGDVTGINIKTYCAVDK
jgi:hypothetical protein